ncbi:hypothetical protein [Paenibacillus campi]|uniref:hypothetical protein n=1 Tax=Paenibacillus campi TaxID=3106031 RepID=UPI002AFED633|nr:hypothetical protein [Paenibacillus sp. SGZ-1014]
MSAIPRPTQQHVPNTNNGCKGCNRSPVLSEDKINQLVQLALAGKEAEELATAAVQEERFQRCMVCPSLQFGTTCKHCGCLVHIRTRLQASRCPSPAGSQWER